MHESSPSTSPLHDRRFRVTDGQRNYLIYPPAGSIAQGPFLPPQNRRGLVMGNANAVPQQQQQQQQRSNLSVMLEGQQHVNESATRETNTPTEFGSLENSPSEADSASGPSAPVLHSNSAPSSVFRARNAPPASLQDASSNNNFHPSARRLSMGDVTLRPGTTSPTGGRKRDVRRYVMCL
jgi:hypothetical protein